MRHEEAMNARPLDAVLKYTLNMYQYYRLIAAGNSSESEWIEWHGPKGTRMIPFH